MNEKQQQLLFDKGITNVPSDALCSDNALEESLGMVYDNGEHRVIQKPVADTHLYKSGSTVLYIHKYNGEERCICYYNGNIYLNNTSNIIKASVGNLSGVSVTSIGKTLIINANGEITYHTWKSTTEQASGYSSLPTLPEPDIQFYLGGHLEEASKPDTPDTHNNDQYPSWKIPFQVNSYGSSEGIIHKGTYTGVEIETNKQEDFNALSVGLYSKNKVLVAQKKAFCQPFFIRYALKLYDDSYTHVSNPILMMPCVTKNSYARWYISNSVLPNAQLEIMTAYSKLYYTMNPYTLRDYGDIIKSIDIFITDGVDVYDTSVDQKLHEITDAEVGAYLLADGIYREASEYAVTGQNSLYNSIKASFHFYDGGTPSSSLGDQYAIDTLVQKNQDSLVKELSTQSLFYKLCSIDITSWGGDMGDLFETHTLETITTQEQLPEDDYFSRSPLSAGFMYAYNNRLNLTDVHRGFFEGFGNFLGYDNNGSGTSLDIYVKIASESGDIWVHHSENSNKEQQGIYFYYPDSRARHVIIIHGANCVCNADLKEHPGLNGAYYMRGLPGIIQEQTVTGTAPQVTTNPQEYLWGQILTSEVNNPYTFKAEGYNTIGTGKVIGMSTTTMALSQDQFGRTDLIVFTTDGVWGMQVSSTGLYQSIHPMSREVCNNAKSITQTDGAVFFSSEKGLMVATGQGVKCVSEQLSGLDANPFAEYMKEAYIAYDYRDSLLWIFNANYTSCWIYSIKSGTFGKYDFGNNKGVTNVVNDYPDYLLQNSDGLLTLLNRPNINKDGNTSNNEFTPNTYSTKLVSRPMKLENALALKSIMHMRHIHEMNTNGTLTLRIFASNNLKNWVELSSLRGTPWKYYKFQYNFANMIATDRFAGTMIVTQERRTDKIR